MIILTRLSLLLIVPLLSFSAVPAVAAPAQQEQLDQSRTQESEVRNAGIRSVRRSLCRPLPPPISPPMRVCAFTSLTSPSNIRRSGFTSSNVSLIPWMRGAVSQRHQQAQQRDESVSHGSWLLCFVLQIGYINAVRFAESSDALYWKNLFRFHERDILNIPDIEQGIKETKCLPSQINHRGQMSCLQYPWEESLWYDLSG